MAKKQLLSTMSKHKIASNNLEKIITQTNARTKKDYHKRFVSMFNAKQNKLKANTTAQNSVNSFIVINEIIKDVENKRTDGKIKHNSLRQYKSTINYALTYIAAAKHPENKHRIPYIQKGFYYKIAETISVEQINSLSEQVLTWGYEDTTLMKQLDKQANLYNSTSAKKMKEFPQDIYQLIMADDFKGRHHLREFVYFNTRFGLRPKEWQHVQILTKDEFFTQYDTQLTQSNLSLADLQQSSKLESLNPQWLDSIKDDSYKHCDYVMIVKNAKATHGRACGSHRFIHFNISKSELKRLHDLIDFLHQKSKNSQASLTDGIQDVFEETVFTQLRLQFHNFFKKKDLKKLLNKKHEQALKKYRAYCNTCKKNNQPIVVQQPTFKKPTLYSTRHQAIANAKAQGANDLQVAALFGHISTRTASNHYAPKRRGNNTKQPLMPNPINMEHILTALNHEHTHINENKFNPSFEAKQQDKPTKTYTPLSLDDIF